MFKLNSLFSQANGSEEEVLKKLVLKLGQCVEGHACWSCLFWKICMGHLNTNFTLGTGKPNQLEW